MRFRLLFVGNSRLAERMTTYSNRLAPRGGRMTELSMIVRGMNGETASHISISPNYRRITRFEEVFENGLTFLSHESILFNIHHNRIF